MYESEHSGVVAREDLRGALLRLDQAVARHEAQLPPVRAGEEDAALQVLRRSVALLRQESERLRRLLLETD